MRYYGHVSYQDIGSSCPCCGPRPGRSRGSINHSVSTEIAEEVAEWDPLHVMYTDYAFEDMSRLGEYCGGPASAMEDWILLGQAPYKDPCYDMNFLMNRLPHIREYNAHRREIYEHILTMRERSRTVSVNLGTLVRDRLGL